MNRVIHERSLVSFFPVIPTNAICMPFIIRTTATVNNNKMNPNLGYENIISATATHMTPVPRVKSLEGPP